MKIETEIKILSWYQIIGGLVGLGIVVQYILQTETFNSIGLIFLFLMFILYFFSIASGLVLMKRPSTGILLSKVNQFLQIMGFAVAGYGFQYISGLKLSFGLDATEGMLIKFDAALSSFQYDWNSKNEEAFIALNIIPIVVIYLLNKIEIELEPEQPFLVLTEK